MALISLLYTSARHEEIGKVAKKWLSTAHDPSQVELVIVTDYPIETRLEDNIQSLLDRERIGSISFGINSLEPNCVNGWNEAAELARGDIFVQIQDDLSPCVHWDKLIREKLDITKPQVLAIDDQYATTVNPALKSPAEFMCHSICTRKYYNQFGYLFHPAYASVYCDNEWTDVAYNLGAVIDASADIKFLHDHARYKHGIVDEVCLKHESPERYQRGQLTYQYRKGHGFKPWVYLPSTKHNTGDVLPRRPEHYLNSHAQSLEYRLRTYGKADTQFDDLVVLIPTIEKRRPFVDILLQELERQGLKFVVDFDERENIGQKRQRMLSQVKEKFFVFIDDDDWISADYREVIQNKIRRNPSADLITYGIACKIDNDKPSLAVHDRKYKWEAKDGVYYRSGEIKHVWRTEAVQYIPFEPVRRGEDHAWADIANAKIKEEVKVHKVLYFYEYTKSGSLSWG